MKIDNELQQVMLQHEVNAKQNPGSKVPQNQAEFADVFSQVSKKDPQNMQGVAFQEADSYKEISATNLATINAMLTGQLEGADAAKGLQDFENEIYTITAMIDGLDSYASKLSQSGTNKEAWEELQVISSQMADMKQKDLPPALNAIVSEIEVLASTEQFKMSRGDYQL